MIGKPSTAASIISICDEDNENDTDVGNYDAGGDDNGGDFCCFTHRQLFRYISDLAWHFDAVNPDILVHGERDRTVQDRGIQAVGLLHHSKDDMMIKDVDHPG